MASWRPRITADSPRLFDNDILELLSRTHPAVVAILYLPLSLYLFTYSVRRAGVGIGMSVFLVVAGAAAWTLAEYWLHRSVMHWIPEADWGSRMHFWVHGIHHEWPNDPLRLVMPPSVSLFLFFFFLGGFYLLSSKYCWSFHAGFTAGYVVYDLTHYWYHHHRPRSVWAQNLQRHHLRHHFNKKYDERNFAISVPFWDRLFGTDRPSRSDQ